MKLVVALWKFSRPHTVIGSVVSILTLYVIICGNQKMQHLPLLLAALAIGVTCNIFIVGINQIADVSIDRVNKPYLPIPAGMLSVPEAKLIVYAALLVSLGLALFLSSWLFGIILLAAAIGWAYSMPPLYLKRHHLTAALSILLVRGLLINAGGFRVFNYLVNGSLALPADVRILTIFITVFSIVIAWFKDLPDVKGDSLHGIRTLAIVYSPATALAAGTVLIVLTYFLTIAVKYFEFLRSDLSSVRINVLLSGHLLLLGLFLLHSFRIDLRRNVSVKKFYKRFWLFFFAEYLLFLAAYWIA